MLDFNFSRVGKKAGKEEVKKTTLAAEIARLCCDLGIVARSEAPQASGSDWSH